jgi:hypothetical protein
MLLGKVGGVSYLLSTLEQGDHALVNASTPEH